jgi:hypothetical protein
MFSTLFGFCLMGAGAQAAPWAEVDAIWAPDAAGEWRRVDRSGAAVLVGETSPEVLRVGLDLKEGSRIRTTQARVRIRLAKKGQMVVRPNSDVELTQGGVRQVVGEVFYSVEGAFRVQYRGVEAAVEGTQFTVGPNTTGGEGVAVAVGEGRVRVASLGESVVVSAGTLSEVLPGAAPVPAFSMDTGVQKSFRSLRKQLGLPSSSLALLSTQSIGALNGGWNTGLRVQGRLRLKPGLRLVAESGLAGDLSYFSLHEAVGLERVLGPVSVGLHGDLRLGEASSCEGAVAAVSSETAVEAGAQRKGAFGSDARLGVSGSFRYRLALPNRFGLETQLRIAYDSKLSGELGLGVSFGS